jgi:hypothetical protein
MLFGSRGRSGAGLVPHFEGLADAQVRTATFALG